MLSFLWSLLSSGSSILYGLLGAAGAIAAALALGKRAGRKEEQDRARIEALERRYETTVQRHQTERRVRDMSDDELDRLQLQYELDEPAELAGGVRGVGSDQNDESRSQHESPPEGADSRP